MRVNSAHKKFVGTEEVTNKKRDWQELLNGTSDKNLSLINLGIRSKTYIIIIITITSNHTVSNNNNK